MRKKKIKKSSSRIITIESSSNSTCSSTTSNDDSSDNDQGMFQPPTMFLFQIFSVQFLQSTSLLISKYYIELFICDDTDMIYYK